MPSSAAATLDDQRFSKLLEDATPKLRAFARRLCGVDADADDIVQDAFAKAWRLRASFRPPEQTTSPGLTNAGTVWLQRIAFRVFCDLRSQRQRLPTPADDLQTQAAPAGSCQVELRDELRHTLTTLPAIERTLLLAFHRDGLSLLELAHRHSLSLNTVKSHLHRARRRLHEAHVAPSQAPEDLSL